MNIYFSGIGGVGIGPLAEIAHDAGYTVAGSDIGDSLIARQLIERGVAITSNQDGSFLRSSHDDAPVDWFVYTSALPENHPELVLARELGIKTAKRDELLAYIIKEKGLKLLAIAGTHGKTTTTGMAVWALQQLGVPVSYSVGSTLSFGPSGKFDPASDFFVYECDEFDRNFLHFTPYVSLVTSIDYDHPDTYPTEQSYLDAFSTFLSQSTMSVLWQADSALLSTVPENAWQLANDEVLTLGLPGAHNRRNATLVAKLFEYLHIGNTESIASALESFPGTDRRFEKLVENLYSDYAHHPVEIAATLQLARELSDNVIVVYQPHQNVRQHEIKNLYTDCFNDAEAVYWLPTYLSREDPALPILTPEELTKNLDNSSNVHVAELDDKLWDHISNARADGKLVLIMGAGSVDAWLRSRLTF